MTEPSDNVIDGTWIDHSSELPKDDELLRLEPWRPGETRANDKD
jgi:hypothetical protein